MQPDRFVADKHTLTQAIFLVGEICTTNAVDGYAGRLYLAIVRLGPYLTPVPGIQMLTH